MSTVYRFVLDGGRRRVDGYMAIVPTHKPVMTWIEGVPGVTRSSKELCDFIKTKLQSHTLKTLALITTNFVFLSGQNL